MVAAVMISVSVAVSVSAAIPISVAATIIVPIIVLLNRLADNQPDNAANHTRPGLLAHQSNRDSSELPQSGINCGNFSLSMCQLRVKGCGKPVGGTVSSKFLRPHFTISFKTGARVLPLSVGE
jgi:hypothetical protein